MYLCYIDESGVPEIDCGTSHFVLVGMAIEAWDWKRQDRAVSQVKNRHNLYNLEVHTGWLTRRYIEQEKIANFETLDAATRRAQVKKERDAQLVRVAALKGPKEAAELRKAYRKTEAYVHLTRGQRLDFLRELADLIGSWGNTRLFCDSIDKTSFGAIPPTRPPREEAFMQIVSRFERYLDNKGGNQIGLLAHDNDETSADRLTQLMRHFHFSGTMWNDINHIIETPFFVDSRLNVGVQLADLCAYAIRRYCENGETDLFDRIYPRVQRDRDGRAVGIRHYARGKSCGCRICLDH